jgi:hypothetical protein
MPARTLNDFFAGFFYRQIGTGWRVKMAMTRQSDRRKVSGRRSNRRKGNVKIIKIEGEGKKQQVTVRQETVPQRKEISIWGWHEEFAIQWSETFITNKRKKY